MTFAFVQPRLGRVNLGNAGGMLLPYGSCVISGNRARASTCRNPERPRLLDCWVAMSLTLSPCLLFVPSARGPGRRTYHLFTLAGDRGLVG